MKRLRVWLLVFLACAIATAWSPASGQTPTSAVGVTGTALELLPPGEPDAISVIVVGQYGPVGVPIIVRNNTDQPARHLNVLATIRDGSGVLLAAVDTAIFPTTLAPGEIAFDRLPFWSDLAEPPLSGVDYSFEVYSSNGAAVTEGSPLEIIPLEVVSSQQSGNQVIGRAKNTTGQVIVYGPTVQVLCFNAVGQAFEFFGESMGQQIQPVIPGAEFPFALDVEGTCDRYLLLVSDMSIGPVEDMVTYQDLSTSSPTPFQTRTPMPAPSATWTPLVNSQTVTAAAVIIETRSAASATPTATVVPLWRTATANAFESPTPRATSTPEPHQRPPQPPAES